MPPILAAAAHNQKLLHPLREEALIRHKKICDEAESADEATLLWAAGEGLVLMDMLGLLPFDSDKKTQLLEVLELKAKETSNEKSTCFCLIYFHFSHIGY